MSADGATLIVLRAVDGNDDGSLSCLVCGGFQCQMTVITKGNGCTTTHGVHRACVDRYAVPVQAELGRIGAALAALNSGYDSRIVEPLAKELIAALRAARPVSDVGSSG